MKKRSDVIIIDDYVEEELTNEKKEKVKRWYSICKEIMDPSYYNKTKEKQDE